jgi:Rieske 2Fe-2S family protein
MTEGPRLRPTLPGVAFTSPEIFAREQELIFERLWFCAVHGSEIAEPGQFRVVPVGRESVLVTRALDGSAHALLNVCRHRGALVCTEPAGRTRRNLRCSYHAWTYALDGSLVSAPHLGDLADVDRADLGLHRVHVREWLGYVWVCLADTPPSFEDTVVAAATERLGDPAAIERYGVEGLRIGRRISYDVKANWKLIVENFMECYHCAPIHPELVRVLPEFAAGYAAQYYVGHGAEFGPDIEGFTIDGSPGVERLPDLAEAQDRRYYAITIRPNVFVNLVPDHVILLRMSPVAADRTQVDCDWLYLPSVLEAGTDLDRSVELFDRVNRQDFDACESCQPGMASRAYAHGGMLVPSEHHLGAFHDWLRRLLGDLG